MALSVGLTLGGLSALAHAALNFARQTGLECTACRVSWLELTTVRQQFKLGGYTLIKSASGDRPVVSFAENGDPPLLPLAAFTQASVSRTSRTSTDGKDLSTFLKNNDLVLLPASLFLAARIAEHVGGFAQWSYDGVAHHGSIDNVDLGLVNHYENDSLDVRYGLSLNNSPTLPDIYNTATG